MSKEYIFDSQADAYRPVKAPSAVTHVVTALVGALTATVALLLAQPDEMSQASFPCMEDEVLTYAAQFGPDRVGCIHMEEIK